MYRILSISGHRFNKLPGKSYNDNKLIILKNEIKKRLMILYEKFNVNIIIDGFAEGIDLLVLQCADELSKYGYNFRIVAALPFKPETQCKYFSDDSKLLYNKFLNKALKVINVQKLKEYKTNDIHDAYLARNQFMIDYSHYSLIVFDFSNKGGARHFYNRAVKSNKDISLIDLKLLYNNKTTLVCDSFNDRRFSALYAKININGKYESIENIYQNSKVFDKYVSHPKGNMPIKYNVHGIIFDIKYGKLLYEAYWLLYFNEHKLMYIDACQYTNYYDNFKSSNSYVSQADAIQHICNIGIKNAINECILIFKMLNIKL